MKIQVPQSNYGFVIEVTMKKIKQAFQKKLTSLGHDLTVDQWVVLDQLKDGKGLSQQDICNRTYKDAPTVTRIIDLMAKKGLLARESDANDRRKFSIGITQKGIDLHNQILPELANMRNIGWQGLSEDDLAQLYKTLNRVAKNMDQYQQEFLTSK